MRINGFICSAAQAASFAGVASLCAQTNPPIPAAGDFGKPALASFDPDSTDANVLATACCAPCHGPGLRGGMQRTLLDGKRLFAKDDAGLRRVINGGLAEKGMPGFGAALKPAQIDALIKFIKDHEVSNAGSPTNAAPPAPDKSP